MTDTTQTGNIQRWVGSNLVDESGSKIGSIEDIYVDDDTRRPEWLAVKTGLFGSRVNFVPIEGLSSAGDDLVSPWDKDKVKDAPHAEADGALSPSEEADLYRHYGIAAGGTATTGQGRGTTAPTGNDAMTRSEEEVRAGTVNKPAGRARLRKWIETEHQTVTVPVRKERAEIVREPITDANRDSAMKGKDLTEGEHEIVLTEEEAVVDKKVVPKERVRLDKDVTVDQERVEADVRKEHIEAEGDVGANTRRT